MAIHAWQHGTTETEGKFVHARLHRAAPTNRKGGVNCEIYCLKSLRFHPHESSASPE